MFREKFWWSLALSIPVIVTSPMVMRWLGYELDFPGAALIPPVLGTFLFFYGGFPFLKSAVAEVRSRQPGMMMLISLAITVAFFASLATSLGLLDLDFWWELAALIVIMLLGHWQEMKAIGQAQGALKTLAALLPDTAEKVTGGETATVLISDLRVGDTVLVRPGGRVPADGRVVSGRAEMDESMVTGESNPVVREQGDDVVAGTVSTDSAVRVTVTAVGEDTALAGIQRMVAEAQAASSRAQALADRFAGWLFYIATAAAALTAIVWSIAGSASDAVNRTVTVLVIACPHALGLAIPLVISISTTVAAKNGILVKSRLALEKSRGLDAVLFDKTGTLTEGRHVVTAMKPAAGAGREEVAGIAAAVESESEHPLAKAIVAYGKRLDGDVPEAREFKAVTGKSVEALVGRTRWAVGGPALLADQDLEPPAELDDLLAEWESQGHAVLYLVQVSGDAQVAAAFALADAVRPEAEEAVAQLKDEGVSTVAMVTGDSRAVADSVAGQLKFAEGEDEVFAQVLPQDKDAIVKRLQQRGQSVAMVGDGVNDAPAIAQADVGVAIGAGTDVAMETAGIVLASSDPRGVVRTIRLSKASYRKMVQNLTWAVGYNVVAVPLAAGVLAPVGFTLSPAVGAVAMSLSTIVVAVNAMTLRGVRLEGSAR